MIADEDTFENRGITAPVCPGSFSLVSSRTPPGLRVGGADLPERDLDNHVNFETNDLLPAGTFAEQRLYKQ